MTDIYVRITQLNFEVPESSVSSSPLRNSAQSTQSLIETIETVLAVRITWLNLEVPVSVQIAEILAIQQLASQSLYEDILTPTPEPQPSLGGIAETVPMMLIGGRPRWPETVLNQATSIHTIDEAIKFSETIRSEAVSTQSLHAIRRFPIGEYFFERPKKRVTIAPWTGSDFAVREATEEEESITKRQEKLLLDLGII